MSKHDDENGNRRGGYTVGDLLGMAVILGTAVGVGAYLLRDQPVPPAPAKKPTRRTAIEVEDYADADAERDDVPRVVEGIN